jgi:hypothetical protein
MIQTDKWAQSAALVFQKKGSHQVIWFLCAVLLAFFVCAQPLWADEDEDKYLEIVQVIQQADALNAKGQTAAAISKYQQALIALRMFRRNHLDWNPPVVAYRLKYLTDKLQTSTAATPSDATDAQKSAGPATAPSETEVKLIDAGSEPRSVLRLHPKAGDKQIVTLSITLAMDMKVGDMATPAIKLPAMTMTSEVTVQQVAEGGDISYETLMTDAGVVDSPGVMPQVAEAMKSSFAGLKGLSGKGLMTSRGVNKGQEISIPSGTDPQLQQALDQMKQSLSCLSTPFPEEPVGAGAKWEAKTPLQSQGMTIQQTATYELVSVNGDQLNLKNSIVQTAANQKIQSPAMPGMKVDLTKMDGSGNGEITVELSRLLPLKGTLQSHADLSMGMNAGGQKQTMSMKMDINMQIETK